MILKEDPDTALFNGNPVGYDDQTAITFGYFEERGFISAVNFEMPKEVDEFFYRNKGSITHYKLPFVVFDDLRDSIRKRLNQVKEAMNLKIAGKKVGDLYFGLSDEYMETLVKFCTYIKIVMDPDPGLYETELIIYLNRLINQFDLDLPNDPGKAREILNTEDTRKFIQIVSDFDSAQEGFDRYNDYSLTGRAWYKKIEGKKILLISFWSDPSTSQMEQASDEIVKRYGKADTIMVQNENYMEDEWTPVGQETIILGDEEIMKEINELTRRLHITSGSEKEQIRQRIRELKAKAGIKDEPPAFGANKKANVASKAGFGSTAEYSSYATQESILHKSLKVIVESLGYPV
ncbi:MAG: hypothetical protein E6R05_02275 [Candidatus Moraniibacteriota bacterium]|nr:MAG: hypothetical protein E6R05_02275 [Candidatus Moranbacteria bacterium]